MQPYISFQYFFTKRRFFFLISILFISLVVIKNKTINAQNSNSKSKVAGLFKKVRAKRFAILYSLLALFTSKFYGQNRKSYEWPISDYFGSCLRFFSIYGHLRHHNNSEKSPLSMVKLLICSERKTV